MREFQIGSYLRQMGVLQYQVLGIHNPTMKRMLVYRNMHLVRLDWQANHKRHSSPGR